MLQSVDTRLLTNSTIGCIIYNVNMILLVGLGFYTLAAFLVLVIVCGAKIFDRRIPTPDRSPVLAVVKAV
jgi:hypothetical protein